MYSMEHTDGNSAANEGGSIRYTRPPGDFIRDELKSRGWTQADLARILGRPVTRINQIIQGKQGVTPETAADLGFVFDTSPDVWLRREFEYRLYMQSQAAGGWLETKRNAEDLRRRKRLYQIAPIKEMQKRGWLPPFDDVAVLEKSVLRFFEIESLDQEPSIRGAFRRSPAVQDVTSSHQAWCFRAKQVAKAQEVPPFVPDNLQQCEERLRKVAAYSQEVQKVPGILASFGVRFVIIEPLQGTKIDGMTTWIDGSPVIGMSLRYDRIDNFWHTLCHELSHVRHGDEFSVDTFEQGPSVDGLVTEVRSETERRADAEAAATLIPAEEMESFIRRYSPLFSKERINQFANRMKIHPGIIVGQLQKRNEIGWSASREMLVKIRNSVTAVALTDGWGQFIDPRVLE